MKGSGGGRSCLRFRLSGLALVALVMFAAFVVLAFVGSGAAQVVGFAGAVVVAIALVGGVPMRGASEGYGLTSTVRGKTIVYAEPQVLDEVPVNEAAWRRERERREAGAAASSDTPAQPPAAESDNPFGVESHS
jgi:hypothetical protein